MSICGIACECNNCKVALAIREGRMTTTPLAKEIIVELVTMLSDGTYNSVRETLALMSEGEGYCEETYRIMSKSALKKVDEALAKVEAWLRDMK